MSPVRRHSTNSAKWQRLLSGWLHKSHKKKHRRGSSSSPLVDRSQNTSLGSATPRLARAMSVEGGCPAAGVRTLRAGVRFPPNADRWSHAHAPASPRYYHPCRLGAPSTHLLRNTICAVDLGTEHGIMGKAELCETALRLRGEGICTLRTVACSAVPLTAEQYKWYASSAESSRSRPLPARRCHNGIKVCEQVARESDNDRRWRRQAVPPGIRAQITPS